MPALIVIGCIILFFAFILSLKAKITIEYNDEISLFVRVLFIKVKILPEEDKKSGPHSMNRRRAAAIKKKLEKKAEKKRLKQLKKEKQKAEKQRLSATQSQKPRTISEVLDMISFVKDTVGAVLSTFFGHLRIDLARLHVTVATGDAATTAIYYGMICDALTHLLPVLESANGFKTPDAQDISVNVDYLADHITADVSISMSIRVWHVLHVALTALKKIIPYLAERKSTQNNGN